MSTSKKPCSFKASFAFVIFDFYLLTAYYIRERALMYSTVFKKRYCVFSIQKTTSNDYNHNAANTKDKGKSAILPTVKLDFVRQGFYFLGESIFNSLTLKLKNIDCYLGMRRTIWINIGLFENNFVLTAQRKSAIH